MAVEIISFDPDGDLLLILNDSVENDDPTRSDGLDGGALEQTATQFSLPDLFASTSLSRLEREPAESPPLEIEPPKFQKEIHMLVSSKHLMLASPMFKAMLQHSNFKEGDELRSSGQVKVPLPDDDPAALKILLDIVHGRVRQVPRHVNLTTMTELSVLVDKYQMLEVVELYVEMWMSTLKTSVPMFFTADLLAWLSISWVFGLGDIFKQISRIAMRGSTDLFGAHESHLPIPQPVFAAISDARRKGIQDAIAVVEYTIMKYQGPAQHCRTFFSGNRVKKNTACDGLILGSLLKSASMNGLWPPPPHPYIGHTFSGIVTRARSLEITAFCEEPLSTFSTGPGNIVPSHGVKQSICAQMDTLEGNMNGLELKTFKEPKKGPFKKDTFVEHWPILRTD
ncbi:hypothetical protein N431DRAFT_435400 [Stipitochalara longipes BDJ]|nr:hypothetical protein N431DRAFT_435400 [Stipitochalara longipes BDJ]